MATLAAQAATDLQIILDAESLADVTNRNEVGTVTIDTTRLARWCELAAAEIAGILGDTDGDDTEAVSLTCDLTIAKFLKTYRPTVEGQDPIDTILERARMAAARRVASTEPTIPCPPDSDSGDRYPVEGVV